MVLKSADDVVRVESAKNRSCIRGRVDKLRAFSWLCGLVVLFGDKVEHFHEETASRR